MTLQTSGDMMRDMEISLANCSYCLKKHYIVHKTNERGILDLKIAKRIPSNLTIVSAVFLDDFVLQTKKTLQLQVLSIKPLYVYVHSTHSHSFIYSFFMFVRLVIKRARGISWEFAVYIRAKVKFDFEKWARFNCLRLSRPQNTF